MENTEIKKAAMTSKERAAWRAQANVLEPLVHVGKNGITDSVLEQTSEALTAHELVKGRVLETAPIAARAAAQTLAAALGADIIQVIGRVFVLYRESEEKREKEKKKEQEKARIKMAMRRQKLRALSAEKKTAPARKASASTKKDARPFGKSARGKTAGKPVKGRGRTGR